MHKSINCCLSIWLSRKLPRYERWNLLLRNFHSVATDGQRVDAWDSKSARILQGGRRHNGVLLGKEMLKKLGTHRYTLVLRVGAPNLTPMLGCSSLVYTHQVHPWGGCRAGIIPYRVYLASIQCKNCENLIPVGLLSIHLKWPQADYFGVFKVNSSAKSAVKNNLRDCILFQGFRGVLAYD